MFNRTRTLAKQKDSLCTTDMFQSVELCIKHPALLDKTADTLVRFSTRQFTSFSHSFLWELRVAHKTVLVRTSSRKSRTPSNCSALTRSHPLLWALMLTLRRCQRLWAQHP